MRGRGLWCVTASFSSWIRAVELAQVLGDMVMDLTEELKANLVSPIDPCA